MADQTRRLSLERSRRQSRPPVLPRPPRRIRCDAWTAVDDALLGQIAGTMTLRQATARINQRSRYHRTLDAVQARIYVLGLSQTAPGMSAAGICSLFRASPATVNRWLKAGVLTGDRTGAGRTSHWVFLDQDIRRFVHDHPLVYDRTRIASRRWRGEADVVWRSLGLISTCEAADWLGISVERLHYTLIKTGHIQTFRGRHPKRFWQLFVRRSDVMNLRERSA